jgi:hypothetical protein
MTEPGRFDIDITLNPAAQGSESSRFHGLFAAEAGFEPPEIGNARKPGAESRIYYPPASGGFGRIEISEPHHGGAIHDPFDLDIRYSDPNDAPVNPLGASGFLGITCPVTCAVGVGGGNTCAATCSNTCAAGFGGGNTCAATCSNTCNVGGGGGPTCPVTCPNTCAVVVGGGNTCAVTCPQTCNAFGTCGNSCGCAGQPTEGGSTCGATCVVTCNLNQSTCNQCVPTDFNCLPTSGATCGCAGRQLTRGNAQTCQC